jgi:hypothetical protein
MSAKPLANDFTEILLLMEELGGRFTKTLTQLYFYADLHNKHIIREAFADEFDRYDSLLTIRKGTTRENPYAPNLHRGSKRTP